MILIELFIFLSTVLPLFHLINAIITRRKKDALGFELISKKKFSILIPCFNEEDTVISSIRGLLCMGYKNYEAIYINDGSRDNTLDLLSKALNLETIDIKACQLHSIKAVYRSKMHKNFFVIDKHNGGKSDALNAGIQLAKAEIVVTLDADSVLEKEALWHMNKAFEEEDVVAAGGAIHIMQGYDPLYLKNQFEKKRNVLITLQILEYLKGFYIYKLSLSKQKATAIISGAFGVFRKEILEKAGGFRKTLGEDIDITLKIQQLIQKTKQRIVYMPEALCYTQCPEDWRDLINQRVRWQKGFINCVGHYKKFILKTFFRKSLTFHFLIEALIVGISSCVFTIFTYIFVIVLAFSDPQTAYTFGVYFAFGVLFNVIYAASSVAISIKYNRYPKDISKKVALAMVLDIVFYRYFNLYMYLRGTASYFWNKNQKNSWNKVARNKRKFYVESI